MRGGGERWITSVGTVSRFRKRLVVVVVVMTLCTLEQLQA